VGFLDDLPTRAARDRRRIVLVEGGDERVREAALRLEASGSVDVTLLVPDAAAGAPAGFGGTVRCPAADESADRYAELYEEVGQRPNAGREDSLEAVRDPLRFAALMVRNEDADGAVAGAVYSTADVIRAAIRCIGTAPEAGMVTGAFYMVVPPFRGSAEAEVLTFADSGVVPDPSAEDLVQIAAQAAAMRRVIVGDEPRVAFLSYSTRGSAGGRSVEKMQGALALFRAAHPHVHADGEFQVDAALVEEIGQRKAPGSAVAGQANVLIFPDLDAGNIGYKLVQIGPILHGLARPFNDLSRGASSTDVERVAYVTALMAADLDS
jgi:phosphate acetyltransferase